MKNEIAKSVGRWLASGRNYDEGVRIYAMYGTFPHLARLMAKRRMEEKLLFVMRELAAKHPYKAPKPAPKAAEVAVSTPQEVINNKPEPGGNLAEELAALDSEVKVLMDERRMHYLGSLGEKNTKEERRKAAIRILELGDLIDQYYDDIAHIKKTGELPRKKEADNRVEGMSAVQLMKRKEVVRTYLSKYGGKPEKISLFKQYEAEMAALEAQLIKLS